MLLKDRLYKSYAAFSKKHLSQISGDNRALYMGTETRFTGFGSRSTFSVVSREHHMARRLHIVNPHSIRQVTESHTLSTGTVMQHGRITACSLRSDRGHVQAKCSLDLDP